MFNDRKCDYKRACLRELSCEVACDYVLPDYLGEVRKILYTEARAMPLPTYMSGDEASASGGVHFRMIYSDAEGRISSAEFSEDYEQHERINESGASGVYGSTEVESYSMRLLGPRKISAKARVATALTLLCDEDIPLTGSAFEHGEPELAEKRAEVLERVISEPVEREYAESLAELEGRIADEVRVIYENATPILQECRASDGEVWMSGEYRVCALIAIGDAPAALYKVKIPFAESIALEGVRADMEADAEILVTSLKINVTPTDTGSSVVASLITELAPEAYGNRDLTLVTDGYMTDREVKCEYGELALQKSCQTVRATEKFKCEPTADELSLEGEFEMLYLTAEPRIKSVEMGENSVRPLVDLKFSGIACQINGDTVTYAPIRYSVERRLDLHTDTPRDNNCKATLGITCTEVDGRCADGVITLCADVAVSAELTATERHRLLCRIDASGEPGVCDRQGKIFVYYPGKDDTLFSVARRFHTTAKRVAIDNSLAEAALADRSDIGSLSGVEMLVIK